MSHFRYLEPHPLNPHQFLISDNTNIKNIKKQMEGYIMTVSVDANNAQPPVILDNSIVVFHPVYVNRPVDKLMIFDGKQEYPLNPNQWQSVVDNKLPDMSTKINFVLDDKNEATIIYDKKDISNEDAKELAFRAWVWRSHFLLYNHYMDILKERELFEAYWSKQKNAIKENIEMLINRHNSEIEHRSISTNPKIKWWKKLLQKHQ